MNSKIKYVVSKLYLDNIISIRSDIVNKAINENDEIEIHFPEKNKTRLLTVEELKNPFKIGTKLFKSKFNDDTYKLIDFLWDNQENLHLNKFNTENEMNESNDLFVNYLDQKINESDSKLLADIYISVKNKYLEFK